MQEININDCDDAASIIELLNKSKRSIVKGAIGEMNDSAIKNFLGTVPSFHNYANMLFARSTLHTIISPSAVSGTKCGTIHLADIIFFPNGIFNNI